jgi:hypothetical protein
MKMGLLPLLLCATGIALGQSANANSAQDSKSSQDLNIQTGPPMLGIHWARGFEPNARIAHEAKPARPTKSPNMTYHGGKIMPTAVTQTIFWGTGWGTYSGDKITGMDQWYDGFNISNYAKTNTEYTGSNGRVGSTTNHLGHIIDTSPSTGGGNTSTILAEVCKLVRPDTDGNGYYAVYTDTPRGHAGYCAWHSYGTAGELPSSLRSSSNSMVMPVAILKTRQAYTRRVCQQSPTSADMNSLRL